MNAGIAQPINTNPVDTPTLTGYAHSILVVRARAAHTNGPPPLQRDPRSFCRLEISAVAVLSAIDAHLRQRRRHSDANLRSVVKDQRAADGAWAGEFRKEVDAASTRQSCADRGTTDGSVFSY